MGAPITAGAAGSEGVGALSPACHRLPTLIVLTPQFCTQLAMPMLPPPRGWGWQALFSAQLECACSHPAARGQSRTLKVAEGGHCEPHRGK